MSAAFQNDEPTASANLQIQMTVAEAARQMNVSVRGVHMAKKVLASGRQDLIDRVERGEMSLHAALIIIKGPKPPDHYSALCRAWNAANDEERARFLVAVGWNESQ